MNKLRIEMNEQQTGMSKEDLSIYLPPQQGLICFRASKQRQSSQLYLYY